MGVCSSSVSAWVFTCPAGVGVEAAEELAKATCVCVTVRVCGQRMERPLRGLQGRTDTKSPGEQRGKAGWAEDLTPVNCLFLRGAAERVSR